MKLHKQIVHGQWFSHTYEGKNNDFYIELMKTKVNDYKNTPWILKVFTKNQYFIYKMAFKSYKQAIEYINEKFY